MDEAGSPTVRRRRLAAALRRLREDSGLTGDQVAARLGWRAGSKISRIENAQSGPKPADVMSLLELYGADDALREELLQLARDAAKKGWWERYGDVLDGAYQALIGLEAEAERLLTWEPQVMPGFLQTEAYAREIINVWQSVTPTPPAVLDRKAEVRLRRQQLLYGPSPLQLHAVIDESVLMRRSADNSVMAEQLANLILAAELPNITLQVLPLDVKRPVDTDSFVHMCFPEVPGAEINDVVYLERLHDSAFLEDVNETYEYFLAFKRLATAALDPASSTRRIREISRERWE